MSRGLRGNTMVEILVGCLILGLLMTLLFAAFRSGAGAWKKVETQAELIGDLQVSASLLQRELERSVPASLSLDPAGNGLAFLSPLVDGGQYTCDINGSIEWKAYCVCWYDPATRTLQWRKIALVGGAPEATVPGPIESYNDGTGAKPLNAYFANGRVIARNVRSCNFQRLGLSVEYQVVAERKRYGTERLESVRLASQITPRN